MKLIYTLIFLLLALVVSAQNDSIYLTQKVYHVGDVIEVVFKTEQGNIQLASDGACTAKLDWHIQVLTSTGSWVNPNDSFSQMDCGLPYVIISNGTIPICTAVYKGTCRFGFLSNHKFIYTDEFRVE